MTLLPPCFAQVYYTTMDQEHRPYKLWRHAMGTPTSDDVLLYTEDDARMW